MMVAVELHVNAAYYAQHSALKEVYGKDQSVVADKLFSSYRTVLSTGMVFWRFQIKWLELLLSVYEALVQKEAFIIC